MRARSFEALKANVTFFISFGFVIFVAVGEVIEASEDDRTDGSADEIVAFFAAVGMPIRRHLGEGVSLIMQRDLDH